MFRRYHYLDANLHKAAKCYLAVIDEMPVAFCAILQHPHNIVKNFRKVHRLVVLPDYQGIGIGKKMISFVGARYKAQNYRFIITSSHPSIIHSLSFDNKWKLIRFGRVNRNNLDKEDKSGSFKRVTACFELI